jgi:RNA polymerase sigma factor (sigma-70 family)
VEPRFESVLPAARTGAEWAWAELYREHAPAVLGYLRARGAADPEDLLGEVFLQLARDLSGFEGDASAFRAWVFTVAHHRLLDDIRKRRRRPQAGGGHALDELDAGVGDAEDDALTLLREQQLARMIARLSPDQQSVLLLRVIADLTVEQVARAIGKRPGAVKALQRRALAALEREISKEGVTL